MQGGYSVASAKARASDVPPAIKFMGLCIDWYGCDCLRDRRTGVENMGSRNSEADIMSVLAGAHRAMFQRGSAEVKAKALEATVQTMDKAYAMVIAGGALALVLSFFLKGRSCS
jgi:hypothetical protein